MPCMRLLMLLPAQTLLPYFSYLKDDYLLECIDLSLQMSPECCSENTDVFFFIVGPCNKILKQQTSLYSSKI